MIFNSFAFLLFFPLVAILYFLMPHRYRWLFLLFSSCLFYAYYTPAYLLILFTTIIIDYMAGLWIHRAPEGRKKPYLIISIVANLSILGLFKYYNFIADNVNSLFHIAHVHGRHLPYLDLLLPMGLSFHTFQAMSYTIDIYRGKIVPEKHFGIYALYIMFFPQLMAGPIERPSHMIPQFYEKKDLVYRNFSDGMKLILWGLFKKAVIADRLSMAVDQLYKNIEHRTPSDLLLATFLFAFQILCDFSGYTDMARGIAQILGFELTVNFNQPFISRSVTEFWRRWHISLSSWFNDYVFNPISTSMRYWGILGVCTALLITFFLSGLWHGAGWNFVLYGLLNGGAVAFEFVTRKYRKKIFSVLPGRINDLISRGITFCYIMFTWAFFRLTNVRDAMFVVKQAPKGLMKLLIAIGHHIWPFTIKPTLVSWCLMGIATLLVIQFLQRRHNLIELINSKPLALRWTIYYTVALCIVFFGVFEQRQFIYFQF